MIQEGPASTLNSQTLSPEPYSIHRKDLLPTNPKCLKPKPLQPSPPKCLELHELWPGLLKRRTKLLHDPRKAVDAFQADVEQVPVKLKVSTT